MDYKIVERLKAQGKAEMLLQLSKAVINFDKKQRVGYIPLIRNRSGILTIIVI